MPRRKSPSTWQHSKCQGQARTNFKRISTLLKSTWNLFDSLSVIYVYDGCIYIYINSPCYTHTHTYIYMYIYVFICASLVTQIVKNLPAMQEIQVLSPSLGRPPEEEMAMHSSLLAWRIPWTEEPGGLQSMGCKELDTTEQLTLMIYASSLILRVHQKLLPHQ